MKPFISPSLACTFFLSIIVFRAAAQDSTRLPDTNIYLLDISHDKKGNLQFSNPQLITKNEGWDNQPWWYPDGSALLYAAVNDSSAGDTSRPDIFKYDMRTHKTINVINTPLASEFSPSIPPNKAGISVIRIPEFSTSQTFSNCDNHLDECNNVFPKLKTAAYYVWIDASRVAIDELVDEDQMQLVVYNLASGKIDTIAENAGRCLQKVPGRNLQIAFVDKDANPWTIKTYDAKGGKINSVVECLQDEEEFCYMPDGSLLMSSSPNIYHYAPPEATTTSGRRNEAPPENDKSKYKEKKKANDKWEQLTDFSGTPVAYFYRMEVSPNGLKLAVVTYPFDKP